MTEIPSDTVTLPLIRDARRPFELPPGLTELPALARMRFPDGHLGWLVTSHELVRAVLADPRFSSRYELLHDPFHDAGGALSPAPSGDLSGVDAPEHTRLRRAVASRFTVRRMGLLTERIRQICAHHLDAMRRQGPVVDLVAAYAQPVPALTICELLGVPYDDHEFFQRQVSEVMEPESMEQLGQAWNRLADYIARLAVAKRAAPTDDVLSELTGTDLDDAELAGLGTFLLGAGLETTRNMIAFGVLVLLDRPDQLALLRADPELWDSAVEELLRYLSIAHTNARTALEDVELGGQTIEAGTTVALSMAAANRDPHRFEDPNVLDVRRRATGHVAFGHGAHLCLGHQLARVELRVALPALLSRFPDLALAVEPGEVPLRHGNVHGVRRLPVRW
ncbi:cytochrome P450 [Nocardia pseudobrasiliensis]|uniref:Cytochrome P450 n=1 Tax=Nocardia pseudobrasiliensis TaxID=45979 RepID=A0A370IAE9_9NOCA|nr:cytochrome P450 [Nocardia pseudobrasiliensis]RDI67687.1 cytochrome P450 [Nocardia pseudobrasiliensis]